MNNSRRTTDTRPVLKHGARDAPPTDATKWKHTREIVGVPVGPPTGWVEATSTIRRLGDEAQQKEKTEEPQTCKAVSSFRGPEYLRRVQRLVQDGDKLPFQSKVLTENTR